MPPLRHAVPFAALGFLVGCSPPANPSSRAGSGEEEEASVLRDGLGREVRFRGSARRIVSLAPGNTEILFALGAGDLLIGRDAFSDHPEAALEVPDLGPTHPRLNAEAIVALEPDLVLASGLTSPDDIEALARVGLTVFATRVASSLDDIYLDLLALGRLVDRSSAARDLVGELKRRVASVASMTARVTSRPKVFYELDATDPAKPWTAGPGSFVSQLIELAGGQNAGALGRDKYFQISLEHLVAEDPEVIVLGSGNYGGQRPDLVKSRPGWRAMSAVRADRVHPFDDNLVARPGPRVVLGLETLARLIHPELFP